MAGTKAILSMRQWCYLELGDEKAVEFVAMATPEVCLPYVWGVCMTAGTVSVKYQGIFFFVDAFSAAEEKKVLFIARTSV